MTDEKLTKKQILAKFPKVKQRLMEMIDKLGITKESFDLVEDNWKGIAQIYYNDSNWEGVRFWRLLQELSIPEIKRQFPLQSEALLSVEIKEGCYIATKDIPDTATWKKVIDKFVEAGFDMYEGYTQGCYVDYSCRWSKYNYVGVDGQGDAMHYNNISSFDSGMCLNLTQLSLSDLGIEPVNSFKPGSTITVTGFEECLSGLSKVGCVEHIDMPSEVGCDEYEVSDDQTTYDQLKQQVNTFHSSRPVNTNLLMSLVLSDKYTFNGHNQVSLNVELTPDEAMKLLNEVEEACDEASVELRLSTDGSGSIYWLNYWPEGNELGHKDKLLLSFGED